MKIKDLYDKEITRRINPAVVVSEMDKYFVDQEIKEYVFTPAITKSIYKFLDAIANKKEGKTGIWISGYYGSGKSHFIKYLFYCLHPEYGEEAYSNFKESVKDVDPLDEPNQGLVTNLQSKLKRLAIDEIIFNIDAVSDRYDTKERITRVLLNQLNQFRGYNNTNIALALYLEKPLDKKGVFNEFKQNIQALFNEPWDGNQLRYARMYLDKVIEIACEFDKDIDKDSLRSTILEKDQDYTIEFLIRELQDYLADKPAEHRLLFLIDEVSQYIGSDTTLLLNLQTIVEEIGAKIGPRVWVVCTAQQELSNLIDSTDKKTEDFGKIFGRFETMISLESQDAAYITKKRILDKKSEGIGILNEFYKTNKGGIQNQFVFDHDLYRNFGDVDEFILTYPFVPYQFRLISDVFDSFSNVGYVGEGVKNTERAILGITHYTANLCKDKEVSYFVPFDLFFNEQLEKNLTHYARNILDRAYKIKEVSDDEFARRVVNGLFMVSNLAESQSVNFPANIENMSLLMMESIDTPKLEIQGKVQKILDVLVNKNIIQVSEGKYRFLKEDEIEVAHLINNTPVTSEDRLTYIFEDIILKIIKPEPMLSFGNRTFRMAIQVDDKEIGQKGDFRLRFSIYENADLSQLAYATPTNDLVVGISEWFQHDSDLKSKVSEYVRTQKYIRLNTATASGTRSETLNNFREANKLLLKEIQNRFENKFMETSFISRNLVIQPGELNTAAAPSRFKQMVMRHMEEVYHKHHLSNGYAVSNAVIISNARSKQSQLHRDLTPAEEELNNKLNFEGENPVAGDIVKVFEKAPYGWKDIATLDILLNLGRKGFRRFEWRNEEIDIIAFAEKAVNSRERDAITIHKEKAHSKEEIEAFIHVVNNEIFAGTLLPSTSTDFKEVVEIFRKRLEPIITKLNKLKEEHEAWPFSIHLKNFYNALSEIYQARNNDYVLSQVFEHKAKLKEYRDRYMYTEEFIEHNFSSYHQIADFIEQNRNNFSSLDETLHAKADDISEFIHTDHEPWEKFPQIKKAFKELSDAIKSHVNKLRSEIIEIYEGIFDELESHRQKLDLDAGILPNREYWLPKIKKENQITQLENHKLKANGFRAEYIKKLDDRKSEQTAKKSGKEYVNSTKIMIAQEMPPTTVETPEQLDEYLNKLRKILMVKLATNKKLFIN
jgi:hypothetical protein